MQTLDGSVLVDCFEFPRQEADSRMTIRPASDAGRTLYEYLLDATAIEPVEAGETACFLGFDDSFPPPEPATATVPSPKLKEWLDRQPGTGIDDLLMCVPLSHRIVTRELVMEWPEHLIQVARTLDLRRLVSALLRRAAALPGRLVAELKRFRAILVQGEDPRGQPLDVGLAVLQRIDARARPRADGHAHGRVRQGVRPQPRPLCASARRWNLFRRKGVSPRLVRFAMGLEPANDPAAALGGGFVSGGGPFVNGPYHYPYYYYYRMPQ